MEAINNLPINLFDAGVVGILLISGLLAYARGFVREVLSIAGWIGAIFATIYGINYVQPYAAQYIDNKLIANLSAGAFIFITTLVVLSMLTAGISKKVQDSALNALDRALGFLFGALRGGLIVVVIYMGIMQVFKSGDRPEWINNARSVELIEPAAKFLTSLIPDPNRKKSSKTTGSLADEASKAVRDLISPSPKAEGAKQKDGYDKRQLEGMERLIGNTQQN